VADSTFVTSQGAFDVSLLVQTQLVNATMHLFQASLLPSPSPTTPLSAFLAAEANFDGYSPATIAAWAAPVLAGNAWAVFAPTQVFRWTFSAGVGNTIGGYWIQTAGGDLKDYTVFNPAEVVTSPGQAIIRTPVEVFPFGGI
jgi:hypothetical protein